MRRHLVLKTKQWFSSGCSDAALGHRRRCSFGLISSVWFLCKEREQQRRCSPKHCHPTRSLLHGLASPSPASTPHSVPSPLLSLSSHHCIITPLTPSPQGHLVVQETLLIWDALGFLGSRFESNMTAEVMLCLWRPCSCCPAP